MKRMLENKRTLIAAAALAGAIAPAQAGLLDIATDPLGTATSSNKPNVMFILDDSGSMGSDYMPDFVNDSHNLKGSPPTTAACADAADDDSASVGIGGSPDACVFGDPPFNSPDLNGIYYNPAIFYRPAANSDGTDMPTQNSANTSDFRQVKVNPYTSTSTTDLSTGYNDRVWCTAQGDVATSGNCRQNSAYQYPDPTFKYGQDGSGNVKYVTGAPYYYRMQSAQYCNSVSGSPGTTCASGSSINLTTHTLLAPEFCSDPELTTCVAGANVDPDVHIFSGVRWCADAGTLVDCRRKKGDLVNLSGTVVKSYIHAKHLGVTASITCPVGTFCNAASNEGNIKITSVNAAGGSISNVTINGVQVVTGAITVPAGSTPSDVAGLITVSINAKASSPEYTAVQSGSNVVITKTATGSTGNGWAVVLTSSTIGTLSSIGRITVGTTSAPSSSQSITGITVNGVNLLCATSKTLDFGNGVTVATSGTITAANGTNSATKRTSMRNAIEARIDTCAVGGYQGTQNGSDVNIVAPVSLGSSPNNLVVAKTGSNLGNVSTGNMGSVQTGTSVNAVNSTIQNMSGGRDALTGTQTIRKGVGAFTRTDIVPANDSYPKAAGRLDCQGATCTYEEEMTNFSNWYAYYRTRMQMIKAAAGRAFVSVGSGYRVGFITICPVGFNCTDSSTSGSNVVSSKYLKIDDFTGTHRDNWYAKLYSQTPRGRTPLREALARVGLIYAGVLGSGLTSGLSAASGDDPVTQSCQPNFAILSTDGYWNGAGGFRVNGSTAIGDQDNTDTGPYSLQSQGVYDGATGASNTLADTALYYYKTDLRPALNNNVPTTSKDTASHQHMVTFTVGLGLDGLLTYRPDYETATSGDFFDIKQGTKKWTVPVADQPTALDDLWHAAVNGRGVFFSAKNPDELANGLAETLDQLQARVGAGAAAATSNLQPVAGDNFAFTAQYQTAAWIGDVKARTIDLATGIVGQVQLWSAASLLDPVTFSNRVIYTFDSTDLGATGNGLKHFCWPGEGGTNCSDGAGLSATEQAYFHPNLLPQWISFTNLQKDEATQSAGPSWTGANAGQNLVNWLRGSGLYNDTGQSLPSDLFRERLSRLGDVINAQPAYVKKSPFNYSDSGYADFKKCTEGTGSGCPSAQFPTPAISRRGTVYAAANDGMLHAFETDVNNNPYYQTAGIPTAATADDAFTGNNAGNGAERWAYIPSVVLPGLYRLADNNTPFPHAYHVDGSPVVADVCISSCSTATAANWRTILVAGLNSGGRGYYALDITNPMAPKALWEFTNSTFCVQTDSAGVPTSTLPAGGDYKSDCNVGLSYGNPVIAKRNEDGKWVVFVTSGYNNNVNGGDGQGYLYMLDAATGVILRRFTTGVGTAASPSGLARINGWATSATLDNTVLAIYGGDLEGNLWRFGIDRSDSATYLKVTKIAVLVNGSGQTQPVTVKPELGEVDVSGFKKRIVMLGTGKFLEDVDKTGPFITQTIYALRDDGSGGAGPIITNVRDTTLVKPRNFTAGTDPDTRTVNPLDPAPNWGTEYGWRIDLPDTGEHVNIDPQLQLGTLVIASNVPTADSCTAGGYAYINFLDYATGSFIPGAPGNMASTKIASSVAVGINVIMLPGGKVVSIVTTADNQQLTKDTPTPPSGFGGKRVSWRELIRDQ